MQYSVREYREIKGEWLLQGCGEKVWRSLQVVAKENSLAIPTPRLILQLPHIFIRNQQYVVEIGAYGPLILRGEFKAPIQHIGIGFQHFVVAFTHNPFDIDAIQCGEIYNIYRRVDRNGEMIVDLLFIV